MVEITSKDYERLNVIAGEWYNAVEKERDTWEKGCREWNELNAQLEADDDVFYKAGEAILLALEPPKKRRTKKAE